jgi:KTSC domain
MTNSMASKKKDPFKIPNKGGSEKLKVSVARAQTDVRFDCGPWIYTPKSTRVEAFRYDYANRAVHVTWTNHHPSSNGHIYREVPYEGFRSMVRAVSKGKQINRSLNSFDYGHISDDELGAPSNEKRGVPGSRARA